MKLSAIQTPKRKSAVRKTKQYKTFKKSIEAVDLERVNKLTKEVNLTIEERAKSIGHLKSTVTLKKLEDIISNDTRARAYLTEQHRYLSSVLAVLSSGISVLRDSLSYEDPLDYKCKTITETKFKYRNTVAEWIDARNSLGDWVDLMRAVIDDIDKASWSLRNVIKLRELETYKENQPN